MGFSSHCGGSNSTLVVGVFVGLLPLFLLLLCLVCFLFDETQIWPGDLRVVCGCVGCFLICSCCGFAAMYMATASCTECYFTAAYLSVRTEPLSDIGQTGGKKSQNAR